MFEIWLKGKTQWFIVKAKFNTRRYGNSFYTIFFYIFGPKQSWICSVRVLYVLWYFCFSSHSLSEIYFGQFMVNHIHRHHESVKYAKCRWKTENNNSSSSSDSIVTTTFTIEGKLWTSLKTICVWLRHEGERERKRIISYSKLFGAAAVVVFDILCKNIKQKTKKKQCIFCCWVFVVTLFWAFVAISNSKETHTHTHADIEIS